MLFLFLAHHISLLSIAVREPSDQDNLLKKNSLGLVVPANGTQVCKQEEEAGRSHLEYQA